MNTATTLRSPALRSSQWLLQEQPFQSKFPGGRCPGANISLLLVVVLFSAALHQPADAIETESNIKSLLPFTTGGNVLGMGERAVHMPGTDPALKVESVAADSGYRWHAFYGATDSPTYTEEGKSIAVATDGSIYVAGHSRYSWNGPGGAPPLNAHAGGLDIAIVKLNSAGAYQWHTFYGSSDDDYGQGVAVAADGGVYVTGYSYANWNGPGDTPPKNNYTGGLDIVVVKLDSAGTYQWHGLYGSDGDDYGYGIAVSANGSCHVTGVSDSSWVGPRGVLPKNPHRGSNEAIVIKLSNTGAYQWHTFHGTSGYEIGYSIAVDKGGSVYVAGSSGGWKGPGDIAPLNPYAGGGGDIMIFKLDTAGTYQWHTFHGSLSSNEYGRGIALDPAGSIYVTGLNGSRWKGPGGAEPLNPFAGASDIVVVKLSNAGTYQWHTFHGCPGWDEGKGIVIDSSGAVCITGDSWKPWNGPGRVSPLNPHTGNYSYNMVVLRLSGEGAYQSHTFYGSSNGESNGNCIAADTGGAVYLAGYSAASWAGPNGEAPLASYAKGYDIVVVKDQLASSPPPQVTLRSPVGNGAVVGTAITFKWNAADRATKYRIQIRLANNRVFKDYAADNLLQVKEAGFPNNGTGYKWRVRAGNDEGWGPWSDYWKITNGKPPRVKAKSPANDATIAGRAVHFRWEAAWGATKYQVKISRPDHSVFAIRTLGNELQIRQTGFPNDGTSYKWQVRAGNAAGWGPYSGKRFFTNGR